MNHPEFILEESEKTALTEKQLANLIQGLKELEVDSLVLQRELIKLVNFSGRIDVSFRDLRLSLQEQELLD